MLGEEQLMNERVTSEERRQSPSEEVANAVSAEATKKPGLSTGRVRLQLASRPFPHGECLA